MIEPPAAPVLPTKSDLASTHGRTLLLFFEFSFALFLPVALTLYFGGCELRLDQWWAVYCIVFLLTWWGVYFNGARLRIWTLRRFLIDKSRFRARRELMLHKQLDASPDPQVDAALADATRQLHEEEWEDMKDKSQSTVNSQGILIAVITLFLTVILQDSVHSDTYSTIIYYAAVTAATVTIVFMTFAIDILDTVSNLFYSGKYADDDPEGSIWYSAYYYRKVGPGPPEGGISYAYYGFAFFSVFVIMAVAFFDPFFAGVGIGMYSYLGYPFWFGYKGKEYMPASASGQALGPRRARVEFSVDDFSDSSPTCLISAATASRILGAIFGVGTALSVAARLYFK